MIFKDENPTPQAGPVAKAKRSQAATAKTHRDRRIPDNGHDAAHSYKTLLAELGTQTLAAIQCS